MEIKWFNKVFDSSSDTEVDFLVNLSKIRKGCLITQKDVGRRMGSGRGTSKSNVSRLERGHHSPRLGTVIDYINALGYDFEIVLREK